MVINQITFPKHIHCILYNENQNMLELQIKMFVRFSYFNTNAIFCRATLVCCKYFMIEFIISYYNLLLA